MSWNGGHIYEHNISNMAKHVWIYNIQWVIYSPSSIIKKHCPKLLSLNTYFTNWQKYRTKFSNVTYHALNCINIFHIQMPKLLMLKFKLYILNNYAKLAISVLCTLVNFTSNILLSCWNHLSKSIPYNLFRLNYRFNAFDKSLISECNFFSNMAL